SSDLEIFRIVTCLPHDTDQFTVILFGNPGFARHNPYVVSFGAANYRVLIGGVYVHDEVFRLDRPNKLHTPHGVVFFIYKARWVIHFEWAVKGPLAKPECSSHRLVRFQRIAFDGVVCLFLEERRYIGNHIPIPHESLQIKIVNKRRGVWHRSLASRQENRPDNYQQSQSQFHQRLLSACKKPAPTAAMYNLIVSSLRAYY